MSYYPEPASHIRDKVKIVLELSNYAAKEHEVMLRALIHQISC